jgi:hypothetical protein
LKGFTAIYLFFSTTILAAGILKGGNLQDDSAAVEIREFPDRSIQAFKEDPDFRYDKPVTGSTGWWDQLLFSFRIWLAEVTGEVNLNWLFKLALYVVCPLILLYVIIKLFNVPISRIFYTSPEGIFLQDQGEEDIHKVDFEKKIGESIQKENYRAAIRYVYLKVLKDFADEQIIRWYPGKTNHDYLYEINNPDLRRQFSKLIYYYEYVWYGDFPVDYATLEKAYALKDKIKNLLPVGQ